MRKELASAYILGEYRTFLSRVSSEPAMIGTDIPIPRVPERLILDLCKATRRSFASNSPLIRVDGPVVVVGDLHGNLQDLCRIWHFFENPYEMRFLFLGDYVDRGEFQLEVITLLLSLAHQYPSQVFLLRGNHEFRSVNDAYGFRTEITEHYSEKVWDAFNDVFDYLPLAAIIDGRFFCVHGGLSPRMKTLEDIESLQLPIKDMSNEMIADLVWSDPVDNACGFVCGARGRGVTFGLKAVRDFLAANKLQAIIRAHESTPSGVKSMFDGQIVRVFSSSGYQTSHDRGGFLVVAAGGEIETHILNPEKFVDRKSAKFEPMKMRDTVLCKLTLSTSFRTGPPRGREKTSIAPPSRATRSTNEIQKFIKSLRTKRTESESSDAKEVTNVEAKELTLDNLLGNVA